MSSSSVIGVSTTGWGPDEPYIFAEPGSTGRSESSLKNRPSMTSSSSLASNPNVGPERAVIASRSRESPARGRAGYYKPERSGAVDEQVDGGGGEVGVAPRRKLRSELRRPRAWPKLNKPKAQALQQGRSCLGRLAATEPIMIL